MSGIADRGRPLGGVWVKNSRFMLYFLLPLQASSGMSSKWRHVGKGMGSMLGEAVQIRLILLELTFYRFHARALPL